MASFFGVTKIVALTLVFLFILGSLFPICFSIWVIVDPFSAYQAIAHLLKDPITLADIVAGAELNTIMAWVLFAISVTVFIFSCLGFWSIIVENRGLLIFYVVILCILFLALATLFIVTLAFPKTWMEPVYSYGKYKFNTSYQGAIGVRVIDEYKAYSFATDVFMIKYKCCGMEGPADFEDTKKTAKWGEEGRKYIKETGTIEGETVRLPVACCKMTEFAWFKNQLYSEYEENMMDAQCPVQKVDFHSKGCISAITEKFDEHKTSLIIVAVVVLAILAQVTSPSLIRPRKDPVVWCTRR